MGKRLYTYEIVKDIFEKEGCILLSTEYNSCFDKLEFICSCGTKSQTTITNFVKVHKCKKCGYKKAHEKRLYTYEFVYNYFLEHDCLLLTKEYIGSKQKLEYICVCGNKDIKIFNAFQQGQRCKKCAVEKIKNSFKLSYKYVKSVFEEKGCVLLSKTYENNSKKLQYICHCGEIAEKTFEVFKNSFYCKKCKGKHASERQTFSYEYVKNYFKEQGCELLSDTYIDSFQKLKYKCDCGNEAEIIFSAFKRGQRCNSCGYQKRAESTNLEYEYVYNFFKENGCELLTKKYINTNQKLKFKCSCGNIDTTSFNAFSNGTKKCKKCAMEIAKLKISQSLKGRFMGENSNNWKGGITPENTRIRNSSDYKQWRLSVFQKDNFTCQICGDNKGHNLQAHHLKNFSDYKELRLDINNGITMCESCHDPHSEGSFHYIYGTRNNTPEQFEEFKNNYLSGQYDHFSNLKEVV